MRDRLNMVTRARKYIEMRKASGKEVFESDMAAIREVADALEKAEQKLAAISEIAN